MKAYGNKRGVDVHRFVVVDASFGFFSVNFNTGLNRHVRDNQMGPGTTLTLTNYVGFGWTLQLIHAKYSVEEYYWFIIFLGGLHPYS